MAGYERGAMFDEPDPATIDAFRLMLDPLMATQGGYEWASEWLDDVLRKGERATSYEGLQAVVDATYLQADVALRRAAIDQVQGGHPAPQQPHYEAVQDTALALRRGVAKRLETQSHLAARAGDTLDQERIGQLCHRAKALGALAMGRLQDHWGTQAVRPHNLTGQDAYRGAGKNYQVALDDLKHAGRAATAVDKVDLGTALARNAASRGDQEAERAGRRLATAALHQLVVSNVLHFGRSRPIANQLQVARAIVTARAYHRGDSPDAQRSVGVHP